MTGAHELTENARETWSAVAEGWERNADLVAKTSRDVQRWLVEHIDPQPGQTMLELAAGLGDTGFEIAKRLGDGRLISTDISEAMTQAAKRRAASFGVANVEFRVMDAQEIDLDDGSVDGVVHRFGPMLLPDPAASVRECKRVLREGGTYAAAVWSAADKNPWVLAMGMSLIMNGIELSGGDPNAPGGIFSLGEPEVFRSLVSDGGFADIEVEALDLAWDYKDGEEAWIQPKELSGPLSVAIAAMSDDQEARVKASYLDLIEQYKSESGYHIPAQALCVSAR